MGHGHHRQQRNHLSRTTGILIRVETIVQWLTLYLLTHMINHPLQHILAKGRKGQLTSFITLKTFHRVGANVHNPSMSVNTNELLLPIHLDASGVFSDVHQAHTGNQKRPGSPRNCFRHLAPRPKAPQSIKLSYHLPYLTTDHPGPRHQRTWLSYSNFHPNLHRNLGQDQARSFDMDAIAPSA
jgi:hypothetical protein